jgi:hypothetical protein
MAADTGKKEIARPTNKRATIILKIGFNDMCFISSLWRISIPIQYHLKLRVNSIKIFFKLRILSQLYTKEIVYPHYTLLKKRE